MKSLIEFITTIFAIVLLLIFLKNCGNDRPIGEILGKEYREFKESFEKGYTGKEAPDEVDSVKADTIKWPRFPQTEKK
jgi:hypothetical protein